MFVSDAEAEEFVNTLMQEMAENDSEEDKNSDDESKD